MRFIHTADWQIGKVFKQFGVKEEALRQARLTAIERLGELARTNGVQHVLVAGDVYDNEAPNMITLRAPIERMKAFADIQWHLLPGNHDPHRPEGVWDRVAQLGLPAHVHLHLTPIPVELTDGAFLLPAPLLRKTEFDDLTAWMDAAVTPEGAVRIGLAHGAVINFSSEGEATNPIDPARPIQARLDYLALGDWHRTLQIGPAVWYAGTPEPDRAGRQERGTALLVDISGPGAPPSVTPVTTGTYRWLTRTERLNDGSELVDLDQRLRSEQDLSRLILRLRLEGTLPLAAHADLKRRLVDLEAAVFHLDTDQAALVVRPTEADLEAIDFDGVIRRSADRLKAMVDDPAQSAEARRRAEDALIELYLRVADQPQPRRAA
jgi:DNA repair exonuclease SbcCD nuclease subunit